MQRTLILLKPDAIKNKFSGKVIQRFENAGFRILGMKMVKPSAALWKKHYAHVADKPFYPDIASFMSSTPVIAMVLEGDNVVDRVREMLGVTDSRKAAPGTLRKEFGTDMMINVAHASDSLETAKKEITRFFRSDELFSYEENPHRTASQ
ncbi:MAG: nucleoside-diphosphate kinase [Patescibacteria group bacterium]